jgi:hypothetical protein
MRNPEVQLTIELDSLIFLTYTSHCTEQLKNQENVAMRRKIKEEEPGS